MHNYYITPEEYEKAEKNGIHKKLLYMRVNFGGMSKRRAMTEPVQKRKDRKYWAKVAESNGIKYRTFIGRVNNLGWSEEKAATKPVRKSKGWRD